MTFFTKSLFVIGIALLMTCLLYTSDAADERSSVDLGGRRIIKKKKKDDLPWVSYHITHNEYDDRIES